MQSSLSTIDSIIATITQCHFKLHSNAQTLNGNNLSRLKFYRNFPLIKSSNYLSGTFNELQLRSNSGFMKKILGTYYGVCELTFTNIGIFSIWILLILKILEVKELFLKKHKISSSQKCSILLELRDESPANINRHIKLNRKSYQKPIQNN